MFCKMISVMRVLKFGRLSLDGSGLLNTYVPVVIPAKAGYVFSVFFRTVNHGKIKVSVRLTVLGNVLVNVFVPEKQASPDFRVFKSSQKKTFLVRETC